MRGGRFALALQATRDVLASLGPQDRVAVITFDRDARVAVAPRPSTRRARRPPGAPSTASPRAWAPTSAAGGARPARRCSAWWRRSRCGGCCCSPDGYPSRGETQRDALRARVMEGHARGVETSIVGLGDGIDDGLCVALAEAGEGRFHYLREESALPEIVCSSPRGSTARRCCTATPASPATARWTCASAAWPATRPARCCSRCPSATARPTRCSASPRREAGW
ncbi:MAG: hypothetical protein IPF99_31635 [Deltaproteobacteria bacterium]|nr:hypothetical protein [Deltaproteobacteria bacterium]